MKYRFYVFHLAYVNLEDVFENSRACAPDLELALICSRVLSKVSSVCISESTVNIFYFLNYIVMILLFRAWDFLPDQRNKFGKTFVFSIYSSGFPFPELNNIFSSTLVIRQTANGFSFIISSLFQYSILHGSVFSSTYVAVK